jgi:hypothetical protein
VSFGLAMIALFVSPSAGAQQIQGNVSVLVVDSSGSVVPGAKLKLVEAATNDTRTNLSLGEGSYNFVHLKIGNYTLTVSKDGYKSSVYNLEVQAAQTTDVKATLEIGKVTEVVEVKGDITPVIERSSNALNTVITPDQIANLPLSDRSVVAMSYLVAGYDGSTWNGLPTSAQSSSIDGVAGASGRWKYSTGADGSAVSPRLESISEMTVATDQLDMSQGFGTSSMTITYVTNSGTNQFHGTLFEDFQNSYLNAKGWSRGKATPKARQIKNEFGGNVGGPIRKDKLFFFGNFSMLKEPGTSAGTNAYFTPGAQKGNFSWVDANNVKHTTDTFGTLKNYNAQNSTSYSTGVNSVIGSEIATINSSLSKGTSANIGQGDPNIAGLTWQQSGGTTTYYPSFRVDYLANQKNRIYLAYNQTKSHTPNSSLGWWPGDGKSANYRTDNISAALGVESTLTPSLINQLKVGYLYSAAAYPTNDTSYMKPGAETVGWGYSGYQMSGQYYNLPTSREQPVVNMTDDVTWSKGSHSAVFGVAVMRDMNRYWDSPSGVPEVDMGVVDIDPLIYAMTKQTLAKSAGIAEANVTDNDLSSFRAMYAALTGRIDYSHNTSTYDPKTHGYSTKGFLYNKLDEVMKTWSLYAQDAYKFRPNLTLNYGLRWDFTGPDEDNQHKYHSLAPADLWGPSGVGNLFKPGTLSGSYDPVASSERQPYSSWNVSPQPAIGIAWSPRSDGSKIERLLGGSKTVIRAGYQLRRFTEPQQFVWDVGSNYSTGLFQDKYLSTGTNSAVGTFKPGTLALGDTLPAYYPVPDAYSKVIHLDQYALVGGRGYTGIDPKIRQPYTQSWNLGVQREIGPGRVVELRYVGNHTIHQWIGNNLNEANIFENGFLEEFKTAQANLARNPKNFGYAGGGKHLPVMEASGVNFTNPDFITMLKNGDVGDMAGTLSGTVSYYCNMVGNSFAPCATNEYYTSAGAGNQPINYWVANPFALGEWTGAKNYTDKGFSNYHSLQAEVRQQMWHGLTFNANYTWSRTMGAATAGDWTGSYTQFTIRNMRMSRVPTGQPQVVHASGTYDLPFGRGKQWLSRNGLLDRVLGNWTVGTIYSFYMAAEFRIGGLYDTFNDQADGGVVLNNVTRSEIQKHIGLHYVNDGSSTLTPYWIDPTWGKSIVSSNKLTSNTTPGTPTQKLWLSGLHNSDDDISITKSASIFRGVKGKLQCEMINAFNHPTFYVNSTGIGDVPSFGEAALGSSPRHIEFRANIEF